MLSPLEIYWNKVLQTAADLSNNSHWATKPFYKYGPRWFSTNEGRAPQVRVKPTGFNNLVNADRQTRLNTPGSVTTTLQNFDITIWGRTEQECTYIYTTLVAAIEKCRFNAEHYEYFHTNVQEMAGDWGDNEDVVNSGYLFQFTYSIKYSTQLLNVITASINEIETERLFLEESVINNIEALPSGSFTVIDALDQFLSQSLISLSGQFVNISLFDSTVNVINDDIDDLQTQIDNLTGFDLTQFSQSLETRFEGLEDRTDTLEVAANGFDDDITILYNSASSLQTQVDNIDVSGDTFFYSNTQDIIEQSGSLHLSGNISAQNITTLETSASNNLNEINNVKSNVTVLFNSASSLQTQIDNLPSGPSDDGRIFGYNAMDVNGGQVFKTLSPFPSSNDKEYTVAMVLHCVNTGSANTAAFTVFDNRGTNGAPDGYGVWFHTRAWFRFDYRRDADQNTAGINLTGIPGPLPGKTYAVAFSHTSGALLASVNGSDTQVLDNFGGAVWNKGIPVAGGFSTIAARPESQSAILAMSMFEGNVGEAFNNAQLKNWTLSASQGFGPSTMFLPGATHKFDFTNISEPLAAPARFYYSGSNPWTHTLATTGQSGVYELTGLLDFPDYT